MTTNGVHEWAAKCDVDWFLSVSAALLSLCCLCTARCVPFVLRMHFACSSPSPSTMRSYTSSLFGFVENVVRRYRNHYYRRTIMLWHLRHFSWFMRIGAIKTPPYLPECSSISYFFSSSFNFHSVLFDIWTRNSFEIKTVRFCGYRIWQNEAISAEFENGPTQCNSLHSTFDLCQFERIPFSQ